MCNPLFGKQESQKSIQESQNQAKIPKDSKRFQNHVGQKLELRTPRLWV